MEPFVAHTTTILSPLTAPFWWQWAIDLAQTYDAQSFWPLFREGLQTRLYHHWPEASALILQTALSLTGFVHYVRRSFDDKINVRMYHYVYLTLYVVLALWLCWQPQHTTILLPLLILTGTPSAAHFITFTHSRLTNAWTILLTLAWIAVAFVCLALPSILSWPMPQTDLNLPFP